ncbi:right-handed parallel beta-helix repeat-containing protein [Frateuria defendens]|uniref:right-handed parallel beta-helix repeat-containing protein n=1 Tax=Frateuria defendens TaxID=2219559 RepID=UPI001379371E|nr:right-handed parallel beta-helix repeat-containing protein [Frateuria defendens]
MSATALPAAAADWWRTTPSLSIGSTTINVRDKGARGDGQHDDTAAIQAAINALPSSGGTVVIPSGIYMINAQSSISLRSHVRLQLASTAQLNVIPNGSERYYLIKAWKVNNVEITGGRIVGDRAKHRGSTGEWGYGINILASSKVYVHDIEASEFWGDGLYVGAIGSAGSAIASADVTINRVVSTGNRRQGLSITPADRVYVVNSTFSNTNGTKPEAGIDIEPQTQGNSTNIRIENTTLAGNQGNGLEVHDHVSGLVVKGSTIKSNKGFGIYTGSPSKGTISANTITVNGLDGVGITRTSHDFQITGNTMTYNSANYFLSRGLSVYTQGANGSTRDLQVASSAYNISVSGNKYTP